MNSNEKIDRHEKWKELVAEQEKSGLSQLEFCRQHNLVASKFGYYRSVIKSQDKVNANQKLFSTVGSRTYRDGMLLRNGLTT